MAGQWELPEGWDGPVRHVEHPEWKVHCVEEPTRRFELVNTATGELQQIRLPSMYPALDVADKYITAYHRQGRGESRGLS